MLDGYLSQFIGHAAPDAAQAPRPWTWPESFHCLRQADKKWWGFGEGGALETRVKAQQRRG